ncbi:MAG: T9SS type A sorting domain-containing protein [Bacteroidales bacterium]|nr:T9SS type A sorting domain-containing protein [Bacteroidales bacterium]
MKTGKYWGIILLAFIAILPIYSSARNTGYFIDVTTTLVDGTLAPFNELLPGDTLYIQPGQRLFLLLRNLKGEADQPIIIINNGGPVIINTDHYFGISIQNCRYIRLTGTGDPGTFYGISIERVESGGGIGLGSKSSDYEIDHVSIKNCIAGGINAKTDPDCNLTATRDVFTQYNTLIHDNFISDVGDEAMYIGSTKYFGQTVQCNGKDTLLLPSLLKGVRVYNNIIQYSGMDGIQVSSASEDCQVYGNLVMYDSQKEIFGQMSGITIGGGSKCDCYNNFVTQGKGNGIEIHGLGGFRIFNNIIIDPGRYFQPDDSTKMRYGIYVTDVSVQPDSSFSILFNTIIRPKSDGIRFKSTISANNLIANNVILDPGNYSYYENGNTSFNGNDSYIMIPDSDSDISLENNFFSRNAWSAGLGEGDYAIQPGSPLIDKGSFNNRGILFDYFNHPRPMGVRFDIGASEYDPVQSVNGDVTNILSGVYPNPGEKIIRISYRLMKDEKVNLRIYNLVGFMIESGSKQSHAGMENYFEIDISMLPPGIYFYALSTSRNRSEGKFIKL